MYLDIRLSCNANRFLRSEFMLAPCGGLNVVHVYYKCIITKAPSSHRLKFRPLLLLLAALMKSMGNIWVLLCTFENEIFFFYQNNQNFGDDWDIRSIAEVWCCIRLVRGTDGKLCLVAALHRIVKYWHWLCSWAAFICNYIPASWLAVMSR